jgi:hypothetical protein
MGAKKFLSLELGLLGQCDPKENDPFSNDAAGCQQRITFLSTLTSLR